MCFPDKFGIDGHKGPSLLNWHRFLPRNQPLQARKTFSEVSYQPEPMDVVNQAGPAYAGVSIVLRLVQVFVFFHPVRLKCMERGFYFAAVVADISRPLGGYGRPPPRRGGGDPKR